MAEESSRVDFWFDPGCPFTWRTSRWLLEVARQQPVAMTWHLMSLSVLNEGKEIPEQHRAAMQQGVRALRVLAAAEDAGGQQALADLYTALGSRVHEKGEKYDDDAVREAVAEVGLPESVAAAVDDEGRDEQVRASHHEGQDRVEAEVGSPVIAIDGSWGFFGPVVVPVPIGEDATRLYAALRLLSTVPAFSELKTARAPL